MKFVFTAWAFVFAFLGASPLAEAQGAVISSDLQQTVDENSRQRVIVYFDLPTLAFDQNGHLASDDAIRQMDGERANIIGRALGVSAATLASTPLSADRPSLVHEYAYSPMAAMYLSLEEIRALAADPSVSRIEPDRLGAPMLDTSIDSIGARTLHNSGMTGEGVSVAILDSGVDLQHPMFSGRIVDSACFSTTDPALGSTGFCPNGQNIDTTSEQAGDNCEEYSDDPVNGAAGCFHGTHVAGIAAGADLENPNQPGQILRGVAPAAGIVAVQVFNRQTNPAICGNDPACIRTFDSDQVAALEWLYTNRTTLNLASVNMSLGGGQYRYACDSKPQASIIGLLRNAGIATVIASGNDSYPDTIGSPACVSDAITVGSVAEASSVPFEVPEQLSSFSNSGFQVDMLAPGSGILSAYPRANDTGDPRVFSTDGTSMATPHVAGAFAVFRAAYPQLTVSQIENALESSGVIINAPRSGFAAPSIRMDAANVQIQRLMASNTGTFRILPIESADPTMASAGPSTVVVNSHDLLNRGTEVVAWTANSADSWLAFEDAAAADGSISAPANTFGGSTGAEQSSSLSVNANATGLEPGVHRTTYSIGPNIGPMPPLMAVSLDIIDRPANDDFSNAATLAFRAAIVADSTGASREVGEPTHAGSGNGGSVWYRWIAPWTGQFAISAEAGTGFDPVLAVYTGSSVGSLVQVAANDNFLQGNTGAGLLLNVTRGTTYYIALSGAAGSTGQANLELTVNQSPTNDDSDSPQSISGASGTLSATNIGASLEDGETNPTGLPGGRSIWFSWMAPATGSVWFDPSHTSFVTLIAAYDSQGTPVAAAAGDAISFNVLAGQTYRIAVDGLSGSQGVFDLSWSMDSPGNRQLVAAMLPTIRTGVVGQPTTAFATIINPASTGVAGENCRIVPPPGFSGGFSYQRTDPDTNEAVGEPNTPVNIPAGGRQSFVVGFTPTSALSQRLLGFDPSVTYRTQPIAFGFFCDNIRPAERRADLNTLRLVADGYRNTDIVTVAQSLSGDGIVSVPQNSVTRFSLTAQNIGTTGNSVAVVVRPTEGVALQSEICLSDPATGACITPFANGTLIALAPGATQTFTVRVGAGEAPVAFSPRSNRLSIVFFDSGTAALLGGTSIAVRTTNPVSSD